MAEDHFADQDSANKNLTDQNSMGEDLVIACDDVVLEDSPDTETPSAVAKQKRSLGSWLYNNNPFYFLSALLVLIGIRLAFGDVPVGSLNCWGMLAALAGYTLVMATAAVLVIRLGRVWDDARSILVTLVLLFVAMSVSFDELLIIAPDQALALTLAGWAFAVIVSEVVLRITHIHLTAVYRGPYHATLALLFWFPYFASPELTGLTEGPTQVRLLLFPWLVGGVALTLLPAIRSGRQSVANNTTPWSWPVFPWALFVFLGVVCVLRAYVLTFSFGPSDAFETSFGALHLFPMAIAMAVLLLEMAYQFNKTGWRTAAMWIVAGATGALFIPDTRPSAELLVTSLNHDFGNVHLLSLIVTAAFYGWTMIRRVPLAELFLLATAGSISLLPDVLYWQDTARRPYEILLGIVIGVALFLFGARTRSATRMLVGVGMLCGLAWTGPITEPLDQYRATLTYHIGFFGLMLTTLFRRGRVGRWLRTGVLVQFVLAGAVAFFYSYEPVDIRPHWAITYLGGLALTSYGYGRLTGDRRFQDVTKFAAYLAGTRIAWGGLQVIANSIGWRAAGTLVGGVASLAVGGWISQRKSRHLEVTTHSTL